MRHKATIAISVAAALVLVAVACTAPKGTPNPNVAPVAVILAYPQAGVAPLKVNFSGVDSTDSDGSVTDYVWSFGDGGTSTDPAPTHTYVNPDNYNARLIVTDDGGADEPTCGTPAAPCASISYGITRAGTDSEDQVWVAEGEYSAFTVVEGIDVRGGYDADFTGAGDASVVNAAFDARTRCVGCDRRSRHRRHHRRRLHRGRCRRVDQRPHRARRLRGWRGQWPGVEQHDPDRRRPRCSGGGTGGAGGAEGAPGVGGLPGDAGLLGPIFGGTDAPTVGNGGESGAVGSTGHVGSAGVIFGSWDSGVTTETQHVGTPGTTTSTTLPAAEPVHRPVTMSCLTNLKVSMAVPAGATYVGASLTGGSNLGSGTPIGTVTATSNCYAQANPILATTEVH